MCPAPFGAFRFRTVRGGQLGPGSRLPTIRHPGIVWHPTTPGLRLRWPDRRGTVPQRSLEERTHSAIGLRRIPDPHALLTHALSHRLHRERCVVPSSCVLLSCCVAGATVSQSLRVVQVALCSACAVQVSRCSPLGNRSPDHRHPGSPTRCAALLSSTLQAFARLCKCRCLVCLACLAACGASRCGDRQKLAPLARRCQAVQVRARLAGL